MNNFYTVIPIKRWKRKTTVHQSYVYLMIFKANTFTTCLKIIFQTKWICVTVQCFLLIELRFNELLFNELLCNELQFNELLFNEL